MSQLSAIQSQFNINGGATAEMPFTPTDAGFLSPSPGTQIAVGTVPNLSIPDTPVLVQSSPYWEYSINKIVFDESGLHVNAVQGPPGTPGDVVRSTAPYGWIIVHWISKRRGEMPTVPSKNMGDNNAVYVRGWKSIAVPGFLLDGTKCNVVEGCYYYELRLPYTEQDGLTIGAMPYSDDTTEENVLGPENYENDIIGPNQPPAGAPKDEIDF